MMIDLRRVEKFAAAISTGLITLSREAVDALKASYSSLAVAREDYKL